MRNGVNRFLLLGAAAALLVGPFVARAQSDEFGPPDAVPPKADDSRFEERWVPSLSISGGANFQKQDGRVVSLLFEDGDPDPVPLRDAVSGDDIVVAPFVGVALEVLAPALPIATRPRFFVGGEILPSFSSTRKLALEGDPDCVRGPEPGAPCAQDEPPGIRDSAFAAENANGQGSQTTAEIGTLVYGANLGVAFPVQAWGRQIRFKPSVAWLNYEVDAAGRVVDAECLPVQDPDRFPNGTSGCVDIGNDQTAFLRETSLTASDSQRFNGVGPALDVEVDTGRFGPIGTSLFLGARAYRVLGDRDFRFGASESFDDVFGTDTAAAAFEVEVAPWLYRAHVGLRLHWLGSGKVTAPPAKPGASR